MEYHQCQLPCTSFIASDDPHSKCVKCMGLSHAHEAVYGVSKCEKKGIFVKTSVSKASTLGLRFLKGSHLCFPVTPGRPPQPSANPRPGVRMWSSRRQFLSGPNSRPGRKKWPFFSNLHHEISRSWKQPFSFRLTNAAAADFTNLMGSVEQGYTAFPVIETH